MTVIPSSAHHPGARRLAVAALIVMAMLWGSTFFSLKALTGRIPVPDMLAVRFLISLAVLGTVGWKHWRMSRSTFVRGLLLGVLFSAAQLLQTYGIQLIPASVSGFTTGLYVVATPVLAALLLRARIPALTWLAVGLAVVGLGILSLSPVGGVGSGPGVGLVVLSALLYAGHIVALDRFSTGATAMSLTLIQSSVMALSCTVAALPGGITLPTSATDWAWMLYLAVLAGAATIFLQVWAQAHVPATPAAVIMATEPVWAAVFAVWFGGEHVTWRMVLGGGSMVCAMMLVIIVPELRRRRAVRRLARRRRHQSAG